MGPFVIALCLMKPINEAHCRMGGVCLCGEEAGEGWGAWG